MKKIYVYLITEEQFLNTEYRPLDVETEVIETEDEWDLADVVTNEEPNVNIEKVVDCNDLMVFKAGRENFLYAVQLK